MAKKYDLVVKTGEYTDQSGATKGRFKNVGVVMQGKDGPYILLDRTFNPAGVPGQDGRESIIVSMYEPRNDQGGQQQQPQRSSNSAREDLRDDIPF